MKKLFLSLAAITTIQFANAQCNELFFSEYVEGYNNNKTLEIYNPTSTAVNLSGYRLIRWSNGSTTADMDINYVQSLTGTIQPYSTFTFFLDKRVVGATGADTILEASLLAIANNIVNAGNGAFYSPDYDANVEGAKMMPFNGDDALSLQKNVAGNWTNVDIFGKMGEQPTNVNGTFSPTGGWTDTPPYNDGQGEYLTKDKTLIRKTVINAGVTTNPTLFNALADWDTLSVGAYSNLGSHTCICSVGIDEESKKSFISVFPSPNFGRFHISAIGFQIKKIEIINVLGEKISTLQYSPLTEGWLELSDNFPKGVYFLKVLGEKELLLEKIVLQ